MYPSKLNVVVPCAAVAAAAASSASAQDFRYSVTVLPPLPGHSLVSANAINNAGEVVGVSYGSPINNQTPYVFRPGQGVQALPLPAGYAFSVPTDINDSGVIVGYAQPTWSAEQSMVGWRYDSATGQFTMLSGVSMVNNINNSGTLVGRGCLSGSLLTCYFEAAPGGAMQTVGPSSFYSSTTWRLVDINDSGQICYTAPGAAGQAQLRDADGTLVPITAPPAPFVRTFTWAIGNGGQVAGRWEYNIGSQYFSRAFVWTAQAGAQVIGIPNNHVRPKGINNLGHVVGETGANETSYLDTWIWTPERGTENLEPLIDPAYQLVMTGTSGINDRGQIIARGISQLPPSPTLTMILTPVPPPCPADWDHNQQVQPADVAAFVNAWFTSVAQGDLVGDFDGNGIVQPSDVAAFVAVWFVALTNGC